MHIAVFYWSPTSSLTSGINNANILAYLSHLAKFCSKLLILDDFNLSCIDWCVHSTSQPSLSYEQQFLNTVDNIYLYQHIDGPT